MFWFLFFVTCVPQIVQSAKILGVFPDYGYSQYILGSSLMKALAERGHEVTFVTTFRQKSPTKNLKEVYLDGFHEFLDTSDVINLYDYESVNPLGNMKELSDLSFDLTEYTLNHTALHDLIRSNEHFDLVILEIALDEALLVLSWYFKAPTVLLNTMGATEWVNEKAGNPAPFSFVPYMFSGYNSHMTFWQRFENCLYHTGDMLYRHLYGFPKHNRLIQKYFPGAPDLRELMYNASLILLNSHVSTSDPVPLMHNMVEVGGFHIATKKLPEDLKQFLDDAKEGVVYFSMGSNLQSKDLSEETRDAFIKAFSKLKQKVLWKWEEDNIPNQPLNLKIGKWFPQQDILVHPNVKAFITHGGLLSTTEAVYAGVPLVGIPIFADQKMNMASSLPKGYVVLLPYHEINEKTLGKALDDVLHDPKYRKNAQKLSSIFHDQETKPMDRAIYWIEYVLRHDGARHLRSAALDLSWYQYFALDVILLLVLSVMCLAFSVYFAFRTVHRSFCYMTRKNTSKKVL